MSDVIVKGTSEEQNTFTEVYRHYEIATEDLDNRLPDFDKKDILFRSHIEDTASKPWPYRTQVFDPRIFTALYEKTARILANKPKGRLVPREGSDVLGAMINNEILNFQWDENEQIDNTGMLTKWALMDLNARKYGCSFGLVKWHYHAQYNKENKKDKVKVIFDGPNFRPLNNRDVLANPSYPTIKNWFQHRDYLTLDELTQINDAARSKPIYKNLHLLREALTSESVGSGDLRANNYQSKNLDIKGLTDQLGRDPYFKVVEVITEYRPDRWVVFAPRHGIILKDIPNPYDHGQIPVVQLKYYPIDEDLYGLSEIEPVEKIQKALNALICQYIDAVNMSTYPIIKVRSTGGAVQMNTLRFGPGEKWLMSDPNTDVVAHNQTIAGTREFPITYRFLVSAMQEALGETSVGISNLVPGSEGKTATEIRDLSVQRNVRDNFNLMFLGEALKKQMMFWYSMNQQFMFNPDEQYKIIRIVGKEAIKYFQNEGLDGLGLNDDDIDMLVNMTDSGVDVQPSDLEKPLYPVKTQEGIVPKLDMDESSQIANLLVEPGDMKGTYDYIPDIESMRIPDEGQMIQARKQLLEISLNPIVTQLLAQQQYQLDVKEVIEDFYEQLGIKNADKYFKKIEGGLDGQIQEQIPGQPIPGGEGGVVPGVADTGNVQDQGLAGNYEPMVG